MRIDAGRAVRVYRMVDGRPRTASLVVGGRDVDVGGPELSLTVDGRQWSEADLVASDVRQAPGSAGLSWTLSAAGGGPSARMVVNCDRISGVVRKWAEITGRGRLERIELDRWDALAVDGFEATGEPVAYNVGPVGLGQPVFGPGMFAGIEHPVAENLAGPGGRGCRYALPVAVDLGPVPYRTPAMVVGAGGREEFWDYLDTMRPVPPRLVVLANNWYHLGATGLMDEAAVRCEAEGFAGLLDRHRLDVEFLCLDDGWERGIEEDWDDDEGGGLWGRMAPNRFPSGLRPLGPRVGLWLSPFGGYGERRRARVAWAVARGLEVDVDAGLLCAAGTRYRAHLAEALRRWTEAGVGYWKLDGVPFHCGEPDHGHPVGPGARTAQVDGFLDLVRGIRAVRPDAVVVFTIGSNPSPWWLSSVDAVWRGGLDDTAAEHPGSRLDRFDTYIDCCLQAYRTTALPLSALATFSIVESAAASYRHDDDVPAGAGLDRWARHCWLAVGRGTLHQDLYVAPDSLTDAEWAVLAEALRWARDRQHVLARSRMVLGDPARGEIYGFVARRDAAATACLRNPSTDAQSVELDWAALLGATGPGPPAIASRYGRAVPLHGPLTLDPFEVLVLEAGIDPG